MEISVLDATPQSSDSPERKKRAPKSGKGIIFGGNYLC